MTKIIVNYLAKKQTEVPDFTPRTNATEQQSTVNVAEPEKTNRKTSGLNKKSGVGKKNSISSDQLQSSVIIFFLVVKICETNIFMENLVKYL